MMWSGPSRATAVLAIPPAPPPPSPCRPRARRPWGETPAAWTTSPSARGGPQQGPVPRRTGWQSTAGLCIISLLLKGSVELCWLLLTAPRLYTPICNLSRWRTFQEIFHNKNHQNSQLWFLYSILLNKVSSNFFKCQAEFLFSDWCGIWRHWGWCGSLSAVRGQRRILYFIPTVFVLKY